MYQKHLLEKILKQEKVENYIINQLEIKFLQTKTINKVFIKSLDNGYDLLIYGVFA